METDIDKFVHDQLSVWPVVAAKYRALKSAQTRQVPLGGILLTLQSNPGRLPVIDKGCPLCAENRPSNQHSFKFEGRKGRRYDVLVNRAPIFPNHLVITRDVHDSQQIWHRYVDMLDMAHSFQKYVIFYNGPHCGASAPDHAHFQAGAKGEMPLCDEILHATTRLLADGDEGFIGYAEQLGRSLFTIETSTQRAAERYALRLLELLPVPEGQEEPLVNVLCWWDAIDRAWRMVIFPRRKHRPDCYGEGEGHLLLSPASVDMGGLWAVPERKDFDLLTSETVQNLYDELCLSRKTLIPVLTGFAQHWENLQPI